MKETIDVAALKKELRHFVEERDWAQFHTPKNLASALSVEASELLELFQWLTDQDSANLPEAKHVEAVREAADILICLVRFADVMNIDLAAAVAEKLVLNAEKYPVEKSRGKASKYNEL